MKSQMPSIEERYWSKLDALTGTERIERSMAMASWSRQMIARQIESAIGPVSPERLKWEVALRIYGGEDQVRGWIEGKLKHVSR